MQSPPSTQILLPSWLKSRMAPRMGLVLGVALLITALFFVLYAYRDIERHELGNTRLYARVLQDHADHTLLSSSVVLRSLEKAVSGAPAPQTEPLPQMLAQPLAMLPFVRSLSLLDNQGRVLASSSDTNTGAQIDLGQLKRGATNNLPDWVGVLTPGRDLSDMDLRKRQVYKGNRQLVPQVHTVLDALGGTRYLVATLNPDYFANHYQLQLAGSPRVAALLGLEGRLITASSGVALAPGSEPMEHPMFQHFLPHKEHGSFIGPGLDGHAVLGSFSTTRSFPWVVLVEHPRSAVWTELRGTLVWVTIATLVGWLVIGLLSLAAFRSLRGHEESDRALVTAHQQMAEKERNQRLLIESVQELMFRTDAEGRLQFVNRQWFVDEITLRPVLGMLFADFIDPRDRDIARGLFHAAARTSAATLASALSGGISRGAPTQLRLRGTDGAHRVLEVSVTPVLSAEQQLIGFAGFAIDVTERELARRQLLEQLEFTARLIEVCPFPIFAKDQSGRYLMVNKAWCDMVGWPVGHVLGKTLPELRPIGDFSVTHAKDQQLMTEGGTLEYEERVPFPNGTWHDLMVRKTSFANASGDYIGVIGSMVDITDFREVERRTREARDAAERASAAKGEFLANVSHELRTPLQTILGFAQVGQTRAREQPMLTRMFSDIHAAGHRMLHLVNNLLDLSRLENSVGSFKLAPGDVRPLLQEVVQELAQLAGSRGVTLRLELPPEPVMALLDGFRLQQVFRNILANGLRFAPVNSEVDVRCGSDAEGCHVEVRDRGAGVPPDEFEAIFAPFVQSSLNQTGTGGTGLGLAISRKIIHVHSGAIRARNHPEGGAVFEVHLPPMG